VKAAIVNTGLTMSKSQQLRKVARLGLAREVARIKTRITSKAEIHREHL
jgi:hypothetical protein